MTSKIHDLGYRSYEGERAGLPWAVQSLAVHSVRRALGLKRAGRHKIVPAVTIAMAFLPAIVMVGMAAFIPGMAALDLVRYGSYYNFTGFAIFLFVAIATPGVLTTDRTSGMLALYLASPLTRSTYIFAKAIGLFFVTMLVTVAPIVFLVIAYSLTGSGPGGLFAFAELLGRAILAGAVSSLVFTGLGMFVSSIPKRWGVASVAIAAAIIIPGVVVGVLTEQAGATDWVNLASPGDVLGKAWQHILDDPVELGIAIDRLPASAVVLTAVAYAIVFLGLTWWRYQNVEVDR